MYVIIISSLNLTPGCSGRLTLQCGDGLIYATEQIKIGFSHLSKMFFLCCAKRCPFEKMDTRKGPYTPFCLRLHVVKPITTALNGYLKCRLMLNFKGTLKIYSKSKYKTNTSQ